MRVPRVRFTIRRMMVLIAVIAVLMLGAVMLQRQAEFKRLAEFHAREAFMISNSSHGTMIGADGMFVHVRVAPTAAEKYHESLAKKYEWAAGHPWAQVEPDPPKP